MRNEKPGMKNEKMNTPANGVFIITLSYYLIITLAIHHEEAYSNIPDR